MTEKSNITMSDFKSPRFALWAITLILIIGITFSLVFHIIELYIYPDIPAWVIGGVAGLVGVPILFKVLARLKL